MKIVALYKTFEGKEFVRASLNSIYNHVDKIIMVHSNISWTGKWGNTVHPEVVKWKSQCDPFDKVVNVIGSFHTQEEQYDKGMEVIKILELDYDFLMLVDTDEVWEEEDLDRAIKFISQKKEYNAFTVQMRTYFKSPFYRLENTEPCKPTIFIRKGEGIEGVRGNAILPRILIPNVFMHHFAYVRESDDIVFDKIKTSTLADDQELVDLDEWIKEKWHKMPYSRNFHTSKGFEEYLKSLKVIQMKDLPHHLKTEFFPIIRMYEENPSSIIERHKKGFFNNGFGVSFFKQEILLRRIKRKESILEIGMLTGNNLFFLWEEGYINLTGIEFLKEAVDIAQKHQEEILSKIEFINAEFPLPLSKTYDKIILFDVLEHIPNVISFLTEVSNCLNKEGEVLIIVPKGKNCYDFGHINFYPDLECLRNVLSLVFIVEEMQDKNDFLFFQVRRK